MKLFIYFIIYVFQTFSVNGNDNYKKAVETSADSITIHFNNLPNKAETLIRFPPDENAFDENKRVKVITIIINENRTALKDLNLTPFLSSTDNHPNNEFESHDEQLVKPASSLSYTAINDDEYRLDPDVVKVYPYIQKNNKHVFKYATIIKPQKPTEIVAQNQYDISEDDPKSFFTITEVKENKKNQGFNRNYESPKYFSQFFKLYYAPVNGSDTIEQENQQNDDDLSRPLINDQSKEDNKQTLLQNQIPWYITPFHVPVKAVILNPVFQEIPSTSKNKNLNYNIENLFKNFNFHKADENKFTKQYFNNLYKSLFPGSTKNFNLHKADENKFTKQYFDKLYKSLFPGSIKNFNLHKAVDNKFTKQYFDKLYKSLFPGSTKNSNKILSGLTSDYRLFSPNDNLPSILPAKIVYIQPVITKVRFAGNPIDSRNYKPLLL